MESWKQGEKARQRGEIKQFELHTDLERKTREDGRETVFK